MRISVDRLNGRNACAEQVKLFRKFFGRKSILITKDLCIKHAQDFRWDWAAHEFFNGNNQFLYGEKTAKARNKYYESLDRISDIRNTALDKIWEKPKDSTAKKEKEIDQKYQIKKVKITRKLNLVRAKVFGTLASKIDL